MTTIRHERACDIAARDVLLDEAFGAARFRKSSERLREDRLPAEGLSFAAIENRRLVGTARLWNVDIGNGARALLLGPVAVACDQQCRGIGAALVRREIRDARKLGYQAVVLIGDAPYYGRFGFSAVTTGALSMPGPYEPHRLLALELVSGGVDGVHGVIAAARTAEPLSKAA